MSRDKTTITYVHNAYMDFVNNMLIVYIMHFIVQLAITGKINECACYIQLCICSLRIHVRYTCNRVTFRGNELFLIE